MSRLVGSDDEQRSTFASKVARFITARSAGLVHCGSQRRHQIAEISVHLPEEPEADGGLVDGDAVEITDGPVTALPATMSMADRSP